MLNRSVHRSVRLVANAFRIHIGNKNNIIHAKCNKSFNRIVQQFLEETLKNNMHVKQTLSNKFQKNLVLTTVDIKQSNLSVTNFNKNEKKETLNTLIKSMYEQPIHVSIKEINDIDAKFCNLLKVMSHYDIFRSLIFLSNIIDFKIIKLSFYYKAIELLRKEIINNIFDKDEIIFCLYFFGLRKNKSAAKDVKTTWKYLQFDDLSLFEKCIVSETLFKCGIKLLPGQIKNVENLIESEAKFLVNNSKLLIPLCKILRLTGTSKDFYPNNLNKEIVNYSEKYYIVAAVHILKLYSNAYILEPKVVKRLVEDTIECLALTNKTFKEQSNVYGKLMFKPKYIDGFLWSLCMLNYKLTDLQLLEVTNFIDNIQSFIYDEPKELLRILLSLWILGYQAEFIIQECIKKNIFLQARNNKFWKIRTSLCLLLHTIQIESPDIKLPNNLITNVYVTLKIRESVKIVWEIVNALSKQMKLQNVLINCPTKGIYIAGVSFDHLTLGSFHIDLLNDTTCLRYSKIPHGFLNLKLRLIKQLGYQSILIDENDLKDTISAFKNIEKNLDQILHTKQ
ncbi:hypothetical protein M0802_008608 [Mischocyttarus mexicanus]|nr:hypothetical protein M0802_008608 [Mischocyttarus mexicanus]